MILARNTTKMSTLHSNNNNNNKKWFPQEMNTVHFTHSHSIYQQQYWEEKKNVSIACAKLQFATCTCLGFLQGHILCESQSEVNRPCSCVEVCSAFPLFHQTELTEQPGVIQQTYTFLERSECVLARQKFCKIKSLSVLNQKTESTMPTNISSVHENCYLFIKCRIHQRDELAMPTLLAASTNATSWQC